MKALSLAERLYEAWWPCEPPVAWRDLSADDQHRFYQASQLIGGVLEPIVRSVRPAEAVPVPVLIELTPLPAELEPLVRSFR